MSKELYIGGKQIELSDAVVALTFQDNDITKPDSIQSNLSNQMKIPRTKENELALESVADVQSLSNLPYTKAEAKYVQDGYELFPSGYAVIDKADERFYYTTIYSGFADLYELIKDKLLSDVEFDAPYQYFNYDVATWLALLEDNRATYPDLPSFLPINDYGDLTNLPSSTISIYDQFPAVWVRHLLKQIFKNAGFTAIGDFIDSDFMRQLYLPYSNDKLKFTGRFYNPEGFLSLKTQKWTNQSANSWVIIPFEDDSENGYDASSLYDPSTGRYTNTTINTITATFRVIVDCTFNYISGTIDADLSIGMFGFVTGVEPQVHISGNGRYYFERQLTINPGEWIAPIVNVHAGGPSVFSINVEPLSKFQTNVTPWEVAANLPAISQKDFIKDVLYLTNSIMKINYYDKTIELSPLENLYVNKGRAKDWTEKIADKSKTSRAYRIPNLARRNYLKWKKDSSSDLSEDFARGTLNVNDDTLGNEKTYHEMKFSPSVEVNRMGSLECIQFKTIDKKKFDPRILIARYRNYSVNMTVVDGYASVNAFVRLAKSFFEPLKFENIIPIYYKNFQSSMLVKSKFIKDTFNLKEVDVYEFDHLIPVYLHQYNDYFYVNKIENFKANSLTPVELIRL